MRTTIVPAQITTVEDRITGNLGFSQLMLLIVPVFIGSGLFVILPPFFSYAAYKIVLIVCLAVACGVLAIRIRGRILLLWLIVLLRYNTRPQYYVFDKNDAHLREAEPAGSVDELSEVAESHKTENSPLPQLTTAQIVQAESILVDPIAKPHFEVTKKGELRVHITEIAQ